MKTETFMEMIFPGPFFSNSEIVKVASRHATIPDPKAFGFRFFERTTYKAMREDGKEITTEGPDENYSAWTYFGDIWTIEHVALLCAQDPKRWDILHSNMRGNGWNRIVRTKYGQSIPLEEEDKVLPIPLNAQ